MEKLGPIDVEFLLNNPEFSQASNKVKDELKGITRTATEEAQRAEAVYKKLGAAIAGYFSVQALSGFAREMVNVRGEFQKLEISLETILGSKERADQILAQAVELAAKTPFDLSGVGDATKQLLAYGFEAENVIEEIRRLGDVSAGLNIPLSDMAYLYGTTRVQGRLFAQDLMQFTNRGIPLIQELAKQFGVAEDEVKNLVSAGKVGFPEVEKAMHNLTNEGGMFFNLMEKQSASIPGQLANLGDAWEMALNDMGKSSEGFISDGIAGVTVLVENYQTVIDIVKVLAISYGSYRAALMLTSVATKAMTAANAGMTASQILLNRWTVIATRAQRILNATMLANPYVAAATALAALISAVVIFNKNTKDSVTVSEDFKAAIKEEINAANELFKTLKNTNEGTAERAEAIKKINEVYGKYLPQQLTEKSNLEDIEAAQKAVNEAIAESIFLRSQESDLANLREGTEKYAERFGKAVQDVIKDAKLSSTVAGQLSAELETAMQEFSKNANTPIAQIQSRFDKILRDFGVDFSLLGSGANNISTLNYQDLLSDTQAYARALNQEKATTEGLAEAKKGYLQQLGLIKEDQAEVTAEIEKEVVTLAKLKEQLKDLTEARERIDVTDTTALAANEKAQVELQRKIAALEIQTLKERDKEAKKTELELLKTRIDEKRKAYEDYYAAIELLGKESADEQFSALRKEGETYIDWLKKAQAGLDPKSPEAGRQQVMITQEIQRAEGTLSPLEQLKIELEEMKRVFADFETYRKQFGLQAAKERFAGELGEFESYLEFVRSKTLENQGAFTAALEGRSTDAHRETVKLLEEESKEAIRIEEQKYQEQLASLQSYLDERNRRIADYEALREELIAKGDLGAAAELDRLHKEELDSLDDANVKKLESYKELYAGIERVTVASAKQVIERAKQLIAGTDMSDELRADIVKTIRETEQELNKIQLDNIFKIANSLGALGRSLQDLGQVTKSQGIAGLGGLLSGMGSGVNDLLTAFDDQASKTDKIAAGISGVVKMVDMLATAAANRREAEERYYRAVIGLQNDYNISLQEQIRLQSMMEESSFIKDYEGRITDALSAVSNANKEYQEAIKELGKGQAIAGQRNALDWGAIGQGAGAGAAIGATIGSVVPVIGNAVGAVVGGIVGAVAGLFGGKKKKDVLIPVLHEYPDLIRQTEEGLISVNRALAEALIANNLVNEETKDILENIMAWEDALEKAREQIKEVVSELAGSLSGDLKNALVEAFRNGEDAAIRMGETVEKVLEGIVGQLVFNKIFSDAFSQLEQEMADSYDIGGDRSWTDDFARFFQDAKGLTDDFNKAMEDAKREAAGFGFDIFKPDSEPKKEQGGLTSAIRRDLTEQTGSELAGLARAMYDLNKRGLELNERWFDQDKRQYDSVIAIMQTNALIERNTALAVVELKAAVAELKGINSNTKPFNNARAYTP